MKLLLLILASISISACAGPCWYGHKAVSRNDARTMKAMGMDVQCPAEAQQ